MSVSICGRKRRKKPSPPRSTKSAKPWPAGYTLTMDKTNHHLHKPVMIGEIQADGQFNVVWQTEGPIRAQPWSPFIQGNDKKPDYAVKSN